MHTTTTIRRLLPYSAFSLQAFRFFLAAFSLQAFSLSAPAAPSQSDILAIAADCIQTSEPKFKTDPAAQNTIRDFRFQLKTQKISALLDDYIDTQTSALTLILASGKQRDLLLLLSSEMLLLRPDNLRVLNLQGAILHAMDDYERAATIYERAVSRQPAGITLRVNLANVYLDFNLNPDAPKNSPNKIDPKKPNRDADAKKILDKLETEIAQDKSLLLPLDKDVCLALSAYWHKQNNASKAKEYWEKTLKIKIAKGKKAKAIDDAEKELEKNTPTPNESLEQMEAKLRELAKSIPLTTADIIMVDFPEAARKIKMHYTTLEPKERLRLPKMPSVYTSNPEIWRRDSPVVEAWLHSIGMQAAGVIKNAYGVDYKAPEEVILQQAKKAAAEEAEKAFSMANDAISILSGMDFSAFGMGGDEQLSPESLQGLRNDLHSAASNLGVSVQRQADGSNQVLEDMTDSLFGYVNLKTYNRIMNAYELYYNKFFNDFDKEIMDIFQRLSKRIIDEELYYENLQQGHTKCNTGGKDGTCLTCWQMSIDHRKRLNEIHESHYKQWEGLCIPRYEQRVKPIIEEYYAVGMLYIKNMPNKEHAQTAYRSLAGKLGMYCGRVVSCVAGGGSFKYEGLTEEQQKLWEEIDRRNEEKREAAKLQAEKNAPPPDEFNYTDWFEKNVSVSVSAGLFSVKISAQSIEFDVSVIAANAGIKYDFEKEKVSTTVGVGLTGKIGVSVGGVGVEVKTKVDVIRQTSTWDLANGKYEETYSTGAKLSGKIGDATLSVSGELNSQLVSKVSASVSRGDISYNLGKSSFDWSK